MEQLLWSSELRTLKFVDCPTERNLGFSSVQSLNRVWLFATPWIAAHQASLSITISRSPLKLMSIESVMPSSHLILCHPLLLLLPIPPSIRVFSNEYSWIKILSGCWSLIRNLININWQITWIKRIRSYTKGGHNLASQSSKIIDLLYIQLKLKK